jgi:hypothetical protein
MGVGCTHLGPVLCRDRARDGRRCHLVVENGLNGVLVSNRGWWERWGNLPGLVDDGGSGWQWWRGWAVCGMQWERDGWEEGKR